MNPAQNEEVNRKGKFVVIEGIDRSGKSTLCKDLALKLTTLLYNHQSFSIKQISFPDRKNLTGSIIDNYLAKKVELNPQTIHLLFSANRWEEVDKINGKLNDELDILISDRYWFSGAAYTTAKGLDANWAIQADAGLPQPDMIIFIDLKPEEAAKRKDYGEERYEELEYQKKCYSSLKKLVKEHKNCVVMDGNLDSETLSSLCVDEVFNMIKKSGNK